MDDMTFSNLVSCFRRSVLGKYYFIIEQPTSKDMELVNDADAVIYPYNNESSRKIVMKVIEIAVNIDLINGR